MLGLNYQSVVVKGSEQQQKSADFLAMNPFGQVPVLADDDVIVRDSQAILVYLAKKFGNGQWLPNDVPPLAALVSWLSTATYEVALGPNRLRLHYKFGRDFDIEESRQVSIKLLDIMQARLESHPYLATNQITIADIAVYPYIALAPEAKIDLSPYPAVIAWLNRIQVLPGYVGMPGMWQSE